jgi:hypothetical protein
MADILLAAKKGGQQQGALISCTEMFNFGIHFWLRVTLVTLFKNGKSICYRDFYFGVEKDLQHC